MKSFDDLGDQKSADRLMSKSRASSDSQSVRVNRSKRRSSLRTKVRSFSLDGVDVDDRGWTPLHVASHTGSLSQVQALLEQGMQVDQQSLGPKLLGATPLHLAAAAGHLEVMDLLLESGANIEARTSGSFGWTPLHLAAKANQQEAMRFLVENGAFLAPDMTDLRFNPPLHYCRGRGLEYAYSCQLEMQQE